MRTSLEKQLQIKNISRYELAKRVNVTYPTIDNIYKGKTNSIKLDILEAICLELDCTPNDILTTDNASMRSRLYAYQLLLEKNKKGDTP